jgi:UDPglucose 6-dehydrogenase
MTHLGLVSATAVASKGFDTICYDVDETLVQALANGDLHVNEPGLSDLLTLNGVRQQFVSGLPALKRCDIVYISPDVPTDDQGRSDLSGIELLIRNVATVLSPHAILVVLCQVPPSFTRAIDVVPHDRLYYQVETLVFGRAVERATRPERYIIGCADPQKPIDPRFEKLLRAFDCPILPMRYESAELAKISINMMLVATISAANTLAEICENIGAIWSEIVPALRLDARIGPHSYLTPGLGIAGGNLERDLSTVLRLASQYNTDAGVVSAWLKNSRHRKAWAAETIRKTVLDRNPDALIAIWGLAYKENTHSVKNSPSLVTIENLPDVRIRAHDPVVTAAQVPARHIESATDPLDAATGADALMILTPWPQYRAISPAQVASVLKGNVVLDPFGVFRPEEATSAGLSYHTLGRPPLA